MTLREGWSPVEPWGMWATGLDSRAQWLALAPGGFRLEVEAFPQCDPTRSQQVQITVNGTPLAEHRWPGCDPWASAIDIPAEQMRLGWNDLMFHYEYAASPAELSQGVNGDPRPLSTGFTKLSVTPVEP